MFERWRRRGETQRAEKQQSDVHSLGVESTAYRFARLEDADQTDANQPGGAPEDPLDADENRELDRAST